MATQAEIALERANKKLAQNGFNPDGSRMEDAADDEAEFDLEGEEDEEDEEEDLQESPTQRRLREMQQQLDAANSRVAPIQRSEAELRDRLATEKNAAALREQQMQDEMKALREQLEERNSKLELEDILSEDERADMDPATLNIVMKLADAVAKKRMPTVDVRSETLKLLAEQKHNEVDNYRKRVLTDPGRGLHQLTELTQDPTFLDWTKDEDNDMDSVVNSLLQARSTEEVDRYAKIISKRIVKFKETRKPQREADARGSGEITMRRKPKGKLSDAELTAKMQEVKRLSRSKNRKDLDRAQQILNEIN